MSKMSNSNEPFSLGSSKQLSGGDEGKPSEIISVLCETRFELDVFGNLLRRVFPRTEVRCFETLSDWVSAPACDPGDEILLFSLGDKRMSDEEVQTELRDVTEQAQGRRVIVTSHCTDTMAVFDAIDCGATSFIPADAGFDELLEAISADISKSVIIPRASLDALRAAIPGSATPAPGLERYFTERQLDVAKALQLGAANKIIAHELGLCESTIKVHIRNIMRKLKATNRTQAAYKLNELANGNIELELKPGQD